MAETLRFDTARELRDFLNTVVDEAEGFSVYVYGEHGLRGFTIESGLVDEDNDPVVRINADPRTGRHHELRHAVPPTVTVEIPRDVAEFLYTKGAFTPVDEQPRFRHHGFNGLEGVLVQACGDALRDDDPRLPDGF